MLKTTMHPKISSAIESIGNLKCKSLSIRAMTKAKPIYGGEIYVNALGDGIVIHESIVKTNGNGIVNRPTAINNAVLDLGQFLGDIRSFKAIPATGTLFRLAGDWNNLPGLCSRNLFRYAHGWAIRTWNL